MLHESKMIKFYLSFFLLSFVRPIKIFILCEIFVTIYAKYGIPIVIKIKDITFPRLVFKLSRINNMKIKRKKIINQKKFVLIFEIFGLVKLLYNLYNKSDIMII